MNGFQNIAGHGSSLLLALWLIFFFPGLQVQGQSGGQKPLGGPRGVVRSAAGVPLEGIMVQLISHKNAIRTTVYSNEGGSYEFPRLESGSYTLRIARPLEYRPYVRDSVQIDGATSLEDIVLERVIDSEVLPPTAKRAGPASIIRQLPM